jgi:hypothetical protein
MRPGCGEPGRLAWLVPRQESQRRRVAAEKGGQARAYQAERRGPDETARLQRVDDRERGKQEDASRIEPVGRGDPLVTARGELIRRLGQAIEPDGDLAIER